MSPMEERRRLAERIPAIRRMLSILFWHIAEPIRRGAAVVGVDKDQEPTAGNTKPCDALSPWKELFLTDPSMDYHPVLAA